MEKNKTYIIADFVKILDVPRTTLKDWMVRYEEFIEFEIRGRRKIYFESSLNILKEIAEMRKAGKTAPEIMLELSYTHPVNADITHEIEAPKIEMPTVEIPAVNQENFPVKNNPLVEALLPIVKQQNEELEHMLTNRLHDMASNLHEAQLASLLPIVKRQNEKTERMLTRKLHDMAENMHRNQLDSNKMSKQSSRRILLVIALILTLVIAVVLTSSNIYYALMNQKEDLRVVEKRLEKTMSNSKELLVSESEKREKSDQKQMIKLQDLSNMLKRTEKNSKHDIENLKSDLKEQQEAFKSMLDKYNKIMIEQRKNETDMFKGNFDKERGVVAKKIDELIKQNAQDKLLDERDNAEVLELKEKVFELKQNIKTLEREKLKAERTALSASYFSKPEKPVKAATPVKTVIPVKAPAKK